MDKALAKDVVELFKDYIPQMDKKVTLVFEKFLALISKSIKAQFHFFTKAYLKLLMVKRRFESDPTVDKATREKFEEFFGLLSPMDRVRMLLRY